MTPERTPPPRRARRRRRHRRLQGLRAARGCSPSRGHDVRVVPTAAALQFVGAPTWAALSGHPVATDVWDDVHEVPHVRLGQQADLVVVAPATADLLARAAHGLADDLLTNTLLTARCPVVMAPGDAHRDVGAPGHRRQRRDPAPPRRRSSSSRRAAGSPAPTPARAGCPSPTEIFAAATRALAGRGAVRDLAGRHVVVSAGGTREPLDPVRFLGNRSSRPAGLRAGAAPPLARGAEVTLVAANVGAARPRRRRRSSGSGPPPSCATPCSSAAAGADAVVMAAAVADFRPARRRTTQDQEGRPASRTRSPWSATADVLAELVASREPDRAGRRRLRRRDRRRRRRRAGPRPRASSPRKGCDLLVVNEVGGRALAASRCPTTPRSCSAPTAPRPSSRSGRRRTWPTRSGTSSATDGRATSAR